MYAETLMKFTKSLKLILLTLFLLLFSQNYLKAQGQVQATITGIPQILPSPYISDFEQNVFSGNYQVQLNVTGSGSAEVRFHVRVTLDSEVLVDETSLPATFNSGFHVLSPFSDFVEFEATTREILQDLPGNRFRQAFQTGSFPEGNYTITIEPQISGSQMPGIPGMANFMVRYPQPPTLISPASGEMISETVTTPVFNWTPVMGPPGMTVEYEFLLVELFDDQNPADAILSNREHASAFSVGNTILPYTGGYLPLEKGKTYAWQVTARDVNGEIPIKNDGRSEIHVFTYGSKEEEDEEEELTVVTPVAAFELTPVLIPVTTISGSVKWRFRPTEGSQSSSPSNFGQSFFLNSTDDSDVQAAVDDPNYSMEDSDYSGEIYTDFSNQFSRQQPDSELQVSTNAQVPVYGGGSTGNVEVLDFSNAASQYQNQLAEISDELLTHPLSGASVKAVVTVDGEDHVIATTEADENGNYTLSFAPSELDRLLSRQDQSESTGGSFSAVGQQNQNQSIDLQNTYLTAVQTEDMELAIASVRIVADSPYFVFSEEKVVTVSTKNTRTYNAGTMTGTALTYRLNPIVLDREDEDPIPGATVEIFRPLDWYDVVPALKPEGWPLAVQDEGSQRILNGSMVVKVAEASASEEITQLFPRKKGSSDRYVVLITAKGYNPVMTHLSSSPDLNENESVTIEKTYKLQTAPPMVEGRVVRRDNQAPVKHALVHIGHPTDQSIQGSATITDSEGRFTITRIPVHEDPYELKVSSSKTSDYTEEILLDERGMVVQKDPIMVDPTLITVVGRVQNDQAVDVANATVKWEQGGTPVQTDSYGRFVTANTNGTHVLQIRKIGHQDLDTSITIEVTEEPEFEFDRKQFGQNWTDNDISNFSNTTSQWVNTVQNSPSFQFQGEEEEPFSFGNLGYAGNAQTDFSVDESMMQTSMSESVMTYSEYSSAMNYFTDLMGNSGSPGETVDAGTLVINRSVGKVDVTVEASSDGSPIEDAAVQVGKNGPNGQTDSDGSIYFDETPAGTIPIQVKAPVTTNFVPVVTEATISDNGEVTEVTITMELGGRASGSVTAAGNPVEGATVRLEGRDDIKTTTDSEGNYILAGIPTGEWTLKASNTGNVGDSQTATFSEDEEQTLDFNLGDAGFNIASLLGFEIEVDELSVNSDTTVTGAFVSIPSNDLLSVSGDFRIPFSDVNVYEENGELLPVGGEVQTDMSEFNAELFDFLQVTVGNSNGIVVRSREIPTDVGYIAGKVEVDYESTFTSATGWEWPGAADQFLELPNTDDLPEGVGEEELVTLTSDGSFPFPNIPDFELRFGSASETIELYGFDVDLALNESVLKNDGFHMNGEITISNIPLLDQSTIALQEFWIGTDGTVREASLDLDPQPQLQLANWALELASGTLSENGFSLGGSVEVSIPGSDPSEISFSDLSLSPDQIFGGTFTLPSAGVDIFGIVDLQTQPGTDITFGKVSNEDVYFLTGAATISLPKYIDKSLEFREFLIQTNGDFSANIAADFEADFFGLADLTVNGVEFETIGTPSIFIDGKFGLRAIPFVNAQAGGLTYQPGGNVSFDEIDLDFDIVGVANVGVGIGLVDTETRQGFSGSGELGITATPLDLGIDFFYERVSGGLSFGADVQAGIPPIPIGTVTLAGIGGGFEFNTSNNEIGVTLRGTVTVAPGTEAVVALDPLEVSVEAGGGNAPVITGFAQLTLMSQDIANAGLTIDFGKPFFDLEARVGFEQLDDVNITVDGSARVVVSGEEGDSYWMVGARYDAELLDLFNANANLLAAWDLDTGAHPEYGDYTDFVSSDYITGGTITGVHLDVATEFGVPKSDEKCLDFAVGSACAYFYNSTRCQLSADFSGGNYGFYLGNNWEGGGSVKLLGQNIGGADISASGEISGSYYNNVWSASGGVSASVSGYVGDCKVGCSTQFCWVDCGFFDCPVPKGASLCARGSIDVDYRSNRGMRISVDL